MRGRQTSAKRRTRGAKVSAATVVAASISFAASAPARAADLLRTPIDANLEHLLAGPDGGAWVSTYAFERQTLRRVFPDGSVRTADNNAWASGVTLGPDGQAWFLAGPGIVRVDTRGLASPITVDGIGRTIATAPDGTVWAPSAGAEPSWLRIGPDGTVTRAPLEVPGCPAFRAVSSSVASDGAVWGFDVTCGFVRFPPGGAPVILGHRLPWADRLVPDRSGGMWFTTDLDPGGGHIDAAGRLTLLRGLGRGTFDVAVAADGSAWFATRTCWLVRATPDGAITRTRVPIPAWEVEFDPAGGVYLASRVRLQHTTLGAPVARCDDRPPRVQVEPNPAKRVSLAALRRNRGFTITVREPFAMESFVTDPVGYPFSGARAATIRAAGRTVRVPISSRKLRQLARRARPELRLLANVRDREGNFTDIDTEVRIRK